jgi:hypothetical protein
MSDQPAPPASDRSTVETDPPLPPPPSHGPAPPRRGFLAWLYGLGFLILAAAIFYVWQHPNVPAETAPGTDTGTAPGIAMGTPDTRAVERKLDAIDTRLSRLEQQPRPPSATDLGKITAQLDALEARVSDQTRLASRLDVLSGRIESLSGLNQSGIDGIRQQLEISSGRLTAVEKTTGTVLESGIDAIRKQLDDTAARLAAVEKTAGGSEAVANRLDRLARIQAASLALANGQPLGELPDAPPALSRYANTAPPTMAHLRLTFPEMERAALAAGPSANSDGRFIDRVWERAQGLVTVRQGDDVVVGNASAVVLTRAGAALEAGDLAAAVRETALLGPNALRAAADWLAEAQALADARAALTDLAAHI